HRMEDYSTAAPAPITLPDMLMMRFRNIMVFDNRDGSITGAGGVIPVPCPVFCEKAGVLHSNMTDAEYLRKAAEVIGKINSGEVYQANLTRKFCGEFSSAPDSFALFCKLGDISPAPYSAYIKWG